MHRGKEGGETSHDNNPSQNVFRSRYRISMSAFR
jgi:hypothetical protein